jgi:LEA14-like dessication related protein
VKIIPIILLAGAAFYVGAKNFLDQLKFQVSSVKINFDKSQAVGFATIFFDVIVRLENPTGFAITLKSFYVKFFYAGAQVGTVTRNTSLDIPRHSALNQQVLLAIPVSAAVLAIQKLLSVIQNSTAPITLDMQGEASLGLFGKIPFTSSITTS